MTRVLDELSKLLKLEVIEQGIYRGQSQDLGYKALFGGQVMGQALSAAQETIAANRFVHSLHSYFLRPGDASMPVVYEVEVIRDGSIFSNRRVQAVQNGKEIFYITDSFQHAEVGFDHQDTMPDVAAPEDLPSFTDYIKANKDNIPESLREKFLAEKPIDVRPVQQYNWLHP